MRAGWWPQSPRGTGTALAPLVCRRGTNTVTPVAGQEEIHPHPTVGVLGASYGPDPPAPCCDPSGNPGRPTVPLHLLGLSKLGDEQGLSRAEGICWREFIPSSSFASAQGWDFPRSQENRMHLAHSPRCIQAHLPDSWSHLLFPNTLFYHHTVFYHSPSFKDKHPSLPRKPLHECLDSKREFDGEEEDGLILQVLTGHHHPAQDRARSFQGLRWSLLSHRQLLPKCTEHFKILPVF